VDAHFEIMGAKRRATSVPPSKAAEAKKPKVEDPSTIALKQLLEAVDGDLRGEMTPKLVQMVLTVAPEALTTMVEDRSDLEMEFGKLVGEALQQAQESLAAKSAEAAATVTEREAETVTEQEVLDKANATKQECDTAVETATTAEKEAKETKNAAIVALNTQKGEEGKLVETTEKLQKEQEDVQFALDTVKGESLSTKDSKKLSQILTTLEAPEALVLGMPSAVGKDGGLEKMFIEQAIKILDTAMAAVQGKQYDWQKHTDEMAAKTKTMDDEVTALTAAHEERAKELQDCKTNQKAAALGIKDAEKQQQQGNKALVKAQKAKEAAETEVTKAAEVYVSYEFLFQQTAFVPEPEFPAEEEAPAEPEKPTEEEMATEEKVDDVVVEQNNAEMTEEQPTPMEMTEEPPAAMEMTEEVAEEQDAATADVKLAAEAPIPGIESAAFADLAAY